MCHKIGASYARRSDRRQSDNHSIETQEREIGKLADQLGYVIEKCFRDDAVSAYHVSSGERPGMNGLLNYVLQQDVDAVFFYDESRVSRQVVDFVEDIWEVVGDVKPDVKFYSVSTDGGLEWDPNDLHTQMRLVFAKEESVVKSRRAKDAQATMLDSKERPGSSAPYGYQTSREKGKRGLSLDEVSAPIVHLIFYLASWGHSSKSIAELLKSAQIPSPAGLVWRASSVDSILNNQAYIGDLVWNVRKRIGRTTHKFPNQLSLFESAHPAIVPAHLWEFTHGLRNYKRNTGNKMSTSNLVQGIARCKRCDETLRVKDYSPANAHGQYVKYVCPKCKGSVKAADLHSALVEHLSREWSTQSEQFQKYARQVLNAWESVLKEDEALWEENLRFAEYSLATKSESPILMMSFRTVKVTAEAKLKVVKDLSQRLLNLNSEDTVKEIFRRFSEEAFDRFSTVEKRAFVLMTVQSVLVSFGDKPKIKLFYRLSPFFALDQAIVSLTEDNGESLGGKPNPAS